VGQKGVTPAWQYGAPVSGRTGYAFSDCGHKLLLLLLLLLRGAEKFWCTSKNFLLEELISRMFSLVSPERDRVMELDIRE